MTILMFAMYYTIIDKLPKYFIWYKYKLLAVSTMSTQGEIWQAISVKQYWI